MHRQVTKIKRTEDEIHIMFFYQTELDGFIIRRMSWAYIFFTLPLNNKYKIQ